MEILRQVIVYLRVKHIRQLIAAYHDPVLKIIEQTDCLQTGAAYSGYRKTVPHQNTSYVPGVLHLTKNHNYVNHLQFLRHIRFCSDTVLSPI